MSRDLHIYLSGHFAGQLTQVAGRTKFRYDDGYRHHPASTPLCLSLPLRTFDHDQPAIQPFLDGLLPDSQAMSIYSANKYTRSGGPSVKTIATMIADSVPHASDQMHLRRRFFEALAFNILIGNLDAHGKNYGLLLDSDRVALAPIYDTATLWQHPESVSARERTSAMRIGSNYQLDRITHRDWENVAGSLQLDKEACLAIVTTLASSLSEVLQDVINELPPALRAASLEEVPERVKQANARWSNG